MHVEESGNRKTCLLRSPVPGKHAFPRSPVPETHDSSAGRPAPLLPAASRAQPRPSVKVVLFSSEYVNDS
jgi:hypothetical protein